MTILYVAIVTVSRDFPYGFCQNTKHQITVNSHIPTIILKPLLEQVVVDLVADLVADLVEQFLVKIIELLAQVVGEKLGVIRPETITVM